MTLHVEDDETVVEIHDRGPGLEPDELERVFTPFYRGVEARTSSKQGVGLGLSSARSIVRAHGGDIRLVLPGEGLLVQVRLPLVGAVKARRRCGCRRRSKRHAVVIPESAQRLSGTQVNRKASAQSCGPGQPLRALPG